jgi:hypothetical protein
MLSSIRIVLLLASSLLVWQQTKAQMPKTNIWLLELAGNKDALVLKNPKKITRDGSYDNQPYFTKDNLGFFYTNEQDNDQTDILYYSFGTGMSERVTKTPESEYSPKGITSKSFTCVRVDKDSAQRVYRYDEANPKGKWLYTQSDSIGYYGITEGKLVYFKITEPPSIWLADSTAEYRISGVPGRCFVNSLDQQKVWFEQKMGNSFLLNHMQGSTLSFSQGLPENAEFFDFYDPRTILINVGKELQLMDLDTGVKKSIAFPQGIPATPCTRMSISSNKKYLAIVFAE